SVRLVNGTSLCSGRLEVKSSQSNQGWSSVCEDDFDQQDAEVVCRELGCGSPSVFQGGLYGAVEAPMWTKEFQCGGNESALMDCRSSGSTRSSCSPGKAVGLTCSEPVRLVGGASRCAGELQLKQDEWRPVDGYTWDSKLASAACRELGCGSVVSSLAPVKSSQKHVWEIRSGCMKSGFTLRDCSRPRSTPTIVELTCSGSVRLMDGTSLCSGRLEVKSSQSNQGWSSVCEDDFDQQDAEVVCRELGCGAPSVFQGGLYGAVEAPMWTKEFQCGVEAPMWTKEFQCGGHEAALMDCRSSGSTRSSCSPGKAVGLTCSEPLRLVGGASRCAGELQAKNGEWRPLLFDNWNLKTASVACRELGCGSAVSLTRQLSYKYGWRMSFECLQSGLTLRECLSVSRPFSFDLIMELTCSKSVRLVDGAGLCSGRLEVKSSQSNQGWSSVCEDDFDQQDAEVVCRELGCGAPSVFQGGLYGAVEAPMWTKEFQCGGHESALMDLHIFHWNLKTGSVVCRELGCGSVGSTTIRKVSAIPIFRISPEHLESGLTLRESSFLDSYSEILELTCLESVRLVNGTSLCSGRLEVKSSQSNQGWSSVCEDDFDQQDAEVVCRELGCGAPSVFQGGLYGAVEAPMWTKEFHCGGNESALMDCRSSGSTRSICSPGKAVGLTCSEPVRLVGGASRCAGELQLKQQEWRPVYWYPWNIKAASVVCRQLGCGSAVSATLREVSDRPVWRIIDVCLKSGLTLKECSFSWSYSSTVELTCSDKSISDSQV
ncbi:hypothetical protein INR49_030311, partial [Caranx melampygus]